MILRERNDPIQTLAPEGTDQAFAQRIGLGTSHGCLDDFQPEASDRGIQIDRKDRVSIMNDVLVRMIRRKRFPKLLQRPGR